jgi:small subunit ribosomal protein S2
LAAISLKQLLEAGVHFGHQTHRWNPKMRDYIFGERNGIYIIDLQKTLRLFKEAVEFVSDVSASGRSILFVGTKRQAQEAVEEEATRCGMFFVTNRWLGGLLTNFVTIRNSLKRYEDLETMKTDGFYKKVSKKEAARLERERKKLEKNLRGIREMTGLPAALFVVDTEKESIAVKEAGRLGIPVVALVDTNCDPTPVDYVIPANDDALRSVRLITSTIAEAIRAGRSVYEAQLAAEAQAAQERAAREAARKAKEEAADAAEAAAVAAAAAQEAAPTGKAAAGGKAAPPREEPVEAASDEVSMPEEPAGPDEDEAVADQSVAKEVPARAVEAEEVKTTVAEAAAETEAVQTEEEPAEAAGEAPKAEAEKSPTAKSSPRKRPARKKAAGKPAESEAPKAAAETAEETVEDPAELAEAVAETEVATES